MNRLFANHLFFLVGFGHGSGSKLTPYTIFEALVTRAKSRKTAYAIDGDQAAYEDPFMKSKKYF